MNSEIVNLYRFILKHECKLIKVVGWEPYSKKYYYNTNYCYDHERFCIGVELSEKNNIPYFWKMYPCIRRKKD